MVKQVAIFTIFWLFFAQCGRKEKVHRVEIPTSNEQFAINEENLSPEMVQQKPGVFKLPSLNFEYNSLEPFMDVKTIEMLYSKVHLQWVNTLNDKIRGTWMESKSIEEIIRALPAENHMLRDAAGAYYNFNLFWKTIGANRNELPSGDILERIVKDFGSYENFKKEFENKASQLLGSGWIWLILQENHLKITLTKNMDNPLMFRVAAQDRGYPLLVIDLWEHAYWIKYANNKTAYVKNFFYLIDWNVVNYRLSLL